MILKAVLIFFVSLLNFWIWRIFEYNVFLAVLLIINSFVFFCLLVGKWNKKFIFIILTVLTIIQSMLIRSDINLKIEDIKPEEILQKHEREFYFTQELGRLFLNKLSLNYYRNFDLTFFKIQRNFFYLLDPNTYFFSGHPRERGLYEFEKYSFLEIPFFILGIIWFIKEKRYEPYIYIFFAFFISIFIDPAFRLGPIFLFPIINCLISIGLMKLVLKK
jgi:hypothetical protein